MDILTGEKVFITGAARGIGRSIAVAMAKAGGHHYGCHPHTQIPDNHLLRHQIPLLSQEEFSHVVPLIMLLLTRIMDKSLKRES